ncbi:MAG: ABC transporter substrate-binding protein [Magnetococcales bacterium]|nr:ABC transporter substrate-binding protein [Magnetococcales bacterium]
MAGKIVLDTLKWMVILLMGLTGIACWIIAFDHVDRPPAVPNDALRIATNPWPGSAHVFIAENKGYFAKNGLKVHLRLTKSQDDASILFKNGEVDGLSDVFSNTILYGSEGVPTRVVYVNDYSLSGDVIVGRPEISSLAELKGRRVGFEAINSFSHLYVLKALETQGLDESHVRFEILSSQDVLSALEKGTIDAGHTWEPTTSRALAKGYKILSRAGDIPGIITDVYAFHDAIIKERPREIQAFVKSMVEARNFATTHRKEAVAIMAQATGMNINEMDRGLEGIVPLDLPANLIAMTPGEDDRSLYHSGHSIIQFLLLRGQLRRIPELNELLDVQFVKALANKE